MKVLILKTYVPVEIAKPLGTDQTIRSNITKFKNVNLSMVTGDIGVEVRVDSKDADGNIERPVVIVPYANIAYFRVDTSEDVEVVNAKKAKKSKSWT